MLSFLASPPPLVWHRAANLGLEIFFHLLLPSILSLWTLKKLFSFYADNLIVDFLEGEETLLSLLLKALFSAGLAVLSIKFLFSPWSFFVFKLVYLCHCYTYCAVQLYLHVREMLLL